MRNRLEEEIKKRLYDYQEEPADDLWNRIVPLTPAYMSGSNKTGASKLITGSIGVIFSISLLTYILNDQKENPGNIPAKQQFTGSDVWSDTLVSLSAGKTSATAKTSFDNSNTSLLVHLDTSHAKFTTPTLMLTQSGQTSPENTKAERETNGDATELNHSFRENIAIHSESGDSVHHGATHTAVLKNVTREILASKKRKPFSKFNAYFTAMPTFGYQRIESNQTDNLIVQGIKKIPTFSLNRLGIRAEIGSEFRSSSNIRVFAGLMYYQRKQTIDYVVKEVRQTNVNTGPDGSILLEPEYQFMNKSFEYELKNLGLQAGLNFTLRKRIFLQTLGTGIEFQVPLNKINEAAKAEGFISNPSAYVFYNLYYRLQYPAESRLKAVIQPTLNYSFYINQNLNAPFYVKPYGLGLNIGCTYNF